MSALGRRRVILGIALGLGLACSAAVHAQLAITAPSEAMDTLNSAPTGSAGGSFDPLGRANNAANAASGGLGALPPGGTGALPPSGGIVIDPATGDPVPGGGGYGLPPGAVGNALNAAGAAVINAIPLTVTVIDGTRIFDAITGELLDDAVEKKVTEQEKASYYDDGTHGDIAPDDGSFTRVDERRDVIGQSSQRVKERLLQALVSAEALNPLEFYGFNIMSLSVGEEQPRNRVWKLVPDPEGGPGRVLREQVIDNPVSLPSYRQWQVEQDAQVKNIWSMSFLHEYRKNKDSLTSEFFPLYIPYPPQAPSVAPPAMGTWTPFEGIAIPDAVLNPQPRRSGGGGDSSENMGVGSSSYYNPSNL